jgi:hypothetical protein
MIGWFIPIENVNLYVQYFSYPAHILFLNKMSDNYQLHPKPKFGVSDDAEDEMLNYQELFRQSNMEPAAKVIREPKIKRQQSNENQEKKAKYSDIDLTETTVMRPKIIVRKILFFIFSQIPSMKFLGTRC